MRYRTNPLVPAVYASSLAAAVVFGADWAASAAGGCIAKPNQQIDQVGHWYYYTDREHHRRCWFFETSEVTTSPASSADQALSANADSQPSWFSRFAAGLAQTLPSETQQNNARDDSSTATKATSPKHPKTSKIAKKERSRIVPPPETTGVASTERGDQLLPQSASERNEAQSPRLTASDRDALYEEFLKWYVDRSILGHP
jgi:hypothetical protein